MSTQAQQQQQMINNQNQGMMSQPPPNQQVFQQRIDQNNSKLGSINASERQKKYNTIDTNMNIQGNNNSSMGGGDQFVMQQPGEQVPIRPGQTQDTAGTSNPSADPNANDEYIDVMRKIPRILCERYELHDVLGKGAHGRIYLATDLVTKDRVAIKMMEKSSKNKSKFQREISLMKDMMKLAKRKPLKENLITYQDPETVAINARMQQQQQMTQSVSSSAISKNRRIGFPRLYSYCSDQNYYYLVMQLLGVNLKELKESFKECKFQIQTVIVIALQLMNRLNSIHSQGYIHRDLKPANVVIGNEGSEAHFIYLIDFGLAKKENSTNPVPETQGKGKVTSGGGTIQDEEKENVIDPKTGKKKTATQTLREYMIEEQDNFRVVGTAMYAALAAHLPNKKYLKKDDIESLLYLLSYFGLGQLPWRYKTNQEGLEKMMNYKYEIKPKELFPTSVFPPQFAKLYEYIRYIPDDQEADYNYIERELMQAANAIKMDPNVLMPLDWMNYKAVPQQQALQSQQAAHQQQQAQSLAVSSPAPYQRASRQHVNSQLSKNTNTGGGSNVAGLKTPLISDKMQKKQAFAMTPDIHTKTYAERSGLGGMGGGGLSGLGSTMGGQQLQNGHYNSIHATSKTSKNQHLMAMTAGNNALNTSSMIVGIGNAHSQNNSHLGMYPNNANNELESEIQNQVQSMNRGGNHPAGSPSEFDNPGEDLIMMNIPREGNADQLNKSTKLTLSSKKQYDNHMQNISLQQHMNNSANNANQQYMLQINGSGAGAPQGQIQQYTSAGMTALNNINAAAMNVTRSKMNSTVMVKFNSSTDKNINQRGNLNKSTLLPNNITHQGPHMNTLANSRNPQIKMNINIGSDLGGDQNLHNNSLEHLNQSLNMQQLSAFSNNQSYQQSPPNIRAKGATIHHGSNAQNTQQNKINTLFDKNKQSATINIKMGNNGQQAKNAQGLYINGLTTGSNMQTIKSQPGQANNHNNQLSLPHAPGAQSSLSNQKSAWNNQTMGAPLTHTNQKNKDRYMQMQQQNRSSDQSQNAVNPAGGANKQQFFIGSTSTNMNHLQTMNNSNLVNSTQLNQNMNSVDIMQNQVSLMHQSPTLSPTGGGRVQPTNGQQYYQNPQYPAYKNIKTINVQPSGQGQYKNQKNQGSIQSGSQFGSRLSHNTNVSNNNSKKVQNTGSNSALLHGQVHTQGSPVKSQNFNQQQSRQSKNSSALGIIGGNIISNNQQFDQSQQNQQQEGHLPSRSGGQNPFIRPQMSTTKSGGMMYNTMYGGISQNNINAQGAQKTPIHIKIEDQTGISGTGNKIQQQNSLPQTTTKKQFQQTGQKFGTAIKAQHGVQNSAPGIGKKMSTPGIHVSGGQTNFNRKKSKAGLHQQNAVLGSQIQSGNTTSSNQAKKMMTHKSSTLNTGQWN